MRPMGWLLLVAGLGFAAVSAVQLGAPAPARVPVVAALLLGGPAVGLWRVLQPRGPVPAVLATMLLGSLVVSILAAEALLLAGALGPLAFVGAVTTVSLLGCAVGVVREAR